jgi:hypothetical protein
MTERATPDCLLDCEEIKPLATKKTHQVVGFRSSGFATKVAPGNPRGREEEKSHDLQNVC